MKITNLEDRLKSEMAVAGGMPGDMNTTAEALRLALQQEEQLKLELGNLKNMENLLGGAGIARMIQMMESGALPGGLESGPASSSGSVPHSPKHGAGGPDAGQNTGLSPDQIQQLRRDVELTKVTGSEASLQYQREIGAHRGYRQQRQEAETVMEDLEDQEDQEEPEAEEVVYRKEVGDAVSVYPKDMSSEAMRGMGGPMEAGTQVYPQSTHFQGMAQGSD